MKITIRSVHKIDVPGGDYDKLASRNMRAGNETGNALKCMHAFDACGNNFFNIKNVNSHSRGIFVSARNAFVDSMSC